MFPTKVTIQLKFKCKCFLRNCLNGKVFWSEQGSCAACEELQKTTSQLKFKVTP